MMHAQHFCTKCGDDTPHRRAELPVHWIIPPLVCIAAVIIAQGDDQVKWGTLLAAITFGLLVPGWIAVRAVEGFIPWRCQRCGQGRVI